MFSVVIPCFQAPAYLDLCLKAALAGESNNNEYIIVIDGCEPAYRKVLARYAGRIRPLILQRHEGMCLALNKGVWHATQPRLLFINEDNVLPLGWDRRLELDFREDLVLSINQVEPSASGYGFLAHNFGTQAEAFDLKGFQAWEPQQAKPEILPDGRVFPMTLSKRLYMTVGGFDQIYPSPHYCDLDFFLKLELMSGVRFGRTHRLHVYHFGQKSTTNPDAPPEVRAQAAEHFRLLGDRAREIYEHKWGVAAIRGPQLSLQPQVRFQNGIRYHQRHEDLRLATIVNFCSNEARFIDACLNQALRFSSQLIVPVCDHFFDGQPENLDLIKQISNRHPEVHFCGFSWDAQPRPPWYWPSLARVVGLRHLEPEIDYVLFLDADEIVEGERMHAWLAAGGHKPYQALSLSNYWYFREPRYQATELEDAPILIARRQLREAAIMDPMERYSILDSAQGQRRRYLKGLDGLPLVHHYSWVRSKEQMLRKVQSWSHREDRDWTALVEAEFSHPFNGKDFVHNYSYKEVEPWLDL